jgi:predicted metal-dependent phosphoesterase TrpH
MNQVDLHCHTTASDGALSPAELVRRGASLGLKWMAITDHDVTSGLEEASDAGARTGVEIIPGVEINTDVPGAEVHLLGYFVDPNDPMLNSTLLSLREGRVERARQMAERLSELGAAVGFERILKLAGQGAVCRPHVAQALVEAGHVATYQEAFARYIGRNGPAYVERVKLTPGEACRLICGAGGLPVLAHPVHYDHLGAMRAAFDLDSGLAELRADGLRGIEVYYPGYDAITIQHLLSLARHHELLVTGGSDFHRIRPGEPDLGGVYVPGKVVRRLREAWAARKAETDRTGGPRPMRGTDADA